MSPYYSDPLVTIYHADCREVTNVDTFDLLLTDPQYQLADGSRANSMGKKSGRGERRKSKGMVPVSKDWGELSGDQSAFDPSHLLIAPKVILWGAIHYSDRLPAETCWLIWDKRVGSAPDDNADCEMAWTNLGGPARIHRQLWRGFSREGAENIANQGAKLHPFQKPIALMKWCILMAPECKCVFDPYCGSGTTLRAAKDLGKKAVGIELEERWCEVAARRMEQEAFVFA